MQSSVIIAYHVDGQGGTMAGIQYIDNFELLGDPAGGNWYTLTVDVLGNGQVIKTPDQPDYYENTVVGLEAIPDPMWQFGGWSGDLTGTTNPTTILMDSNKYVTATFIVDLSGEAGIHYNRFCNLDHCDAAGIAIHNFDDMVTLDARWNWYGAPDGPGSDPTTFDAVTGRPADGFGDDVYGSLRFDPWWGIDAVANIMHENVMLGDPIIFDGSDSMAFFNGSIPVSYLWDFDDGFYSYEEETGHVYAEPGVYNGYLRVQAYAADLWPGPMFDWAYFTITVTEPGTPLVANADANNFGSYEAIVNEPVDIYGQATGGTPPYSYQWTFDDGHSSTEQNPAHTYDNVGTYEVTLTVTDNEGLTATDTATVVVTDRDTLIANANGPYNGIAGEMVRLTGTASGGLAPYTYTWDLGDGTTVTSQNPTYIYETEGIYTVTLTVTDSLGNIDEATSTVEISEDVDDVVIKNVNGGLGIKATVVAGEIPVDWTITIDGTYVFGQTSSSGIVDANAETIIKAPFTLGIGNVDITITANSLIEEYTALMIGPFVLGLQ
jgi:PKD repeat protein